jgi:sugar phosphate isomerase/epimerase
LGVCAPIEKAAEIRDAGFDFIECTVTSLKGEKSDDEVRDIMEQYRNSPLPVEAFNILLPGDLKVVGEAVDYDRVRRYIAKSMERVQAVGGKIVVFGSGKARSVPEGFDQGKAEEQLEKFLHLLADVTDNSGITIVIEPLNRGESNIINSVPEGYDLAKRVNRPSIRALADFYHMELENEPLDNIVSCGDLIKHIHVADSGRLAPGTGEYPYSRFVECVRKAGYEGRVSIECKWQDFSAEVVSSEKFLRGIF